MSESAIKITYSNSPSIALEGLNCLTVEQADRVLTRAAEYGVNITSNINTDYSVTPKPGSALDAFIGLPVVQFFS